jgi:transposase InsO family protein
VYSSGNYSSKALHQLFSKTGFFNLSHSSKNLEMVHFEGICKNTQYLFVNGQEAQQVIEAWRHEYNHYRPHSSLGYQSPVAFAQQQAAVAGLVAETALPKTESQSILSF